MLDNETIIKMHNSGATVRQISDETKFSKSKVHRIITAHIESIEPSVEVVEVKATVNAGKVFSSFVGWLRIATNQYSNKDTGEVVNVKFVPSNNVDQCGYFVTV